MILAQSASETVCASCVGPVSASQGSSRAEGTAHTRDTGGVYGVVNPTDRRKGLLEEASQAGVAADVDGEEVHVGARLSQLILREGITL